MQQGDVTGTDERGICRPKNNGIFETGVWVGAIDKNIKNIHIVGILVGVLVAIVACCIIGGITYNKYVIYLGMFLIVVGFFVFFYRQHTKISQQQWEQIQQQQLEKERIADDERKQRQQKIRKELKTSYNNINDGYLVLKNAIRKGKCKADDYIDIEEMVKELDTMTNKIDSTLTSFSDLYQEHESNISSTDDNFFQYNILTEFNTETEEVKRSLATFNDQLSEITKEYGATPEGKLARKTKDKAAKLKDQDVLAIYKLPVKLTHQDDKYKLRRYELGTENPLKPNKHIMMAGMTGAGKSLLINNVINYVYGVSYKDKFRFKLIVEDEEIEERGPNASSSKAESMTSWVSSFALHHEEGFLVDYSLTIIDTPGFGDTRGIKYDELIIDQLRNFFGNAKVCPIQELSCIGLVIQASQARITEEQKYIYDQVLNIFGKDMTENIFLMFTFADAQPPPALEVVKNNQIPFQMDNTFKFNNSALYAPNNDISADYSWVFGYDSLKKFFLHLGRARSTSLVMTREVLKERDNLKILLEGLQKRIDGGMDMLQSIENMINDILTLKGTMRANKDYKIKSKRHPQTTKVVDHYITNCKSCMFTCHDPCYIAGDIKSGCASMYNGKCGICAGKCPWDMHANGDRIYVYDEIEVETTVEEMMQKYQIAVNDKDGKKKLLTKMLEEYRAYRQQVFSDIKLAASAAKRLEEIALRNTFLTNVIYIERLIRSEEQSEHRNKKIRLEQLNHFKKMAKTLEQARNNPNQLTDTVSKYEQTIIKAINDIQDEITDYSQYFTYSNPELSRNDPNPKTGKKKDTGSKKSNGNKSKGMFGGLFS